MYMQERLLFTVYVKSDKKFYHFDSSSSHNKEEARSLANNLTAVTRDYLVVNFHG